MLTVDISSLSPGIHHREFTPSTTEVELDPTTFENVSIEAELQYHRDRILVKLEVSATAHLTCDRTLEPYEQPVTGRYGLLFGPPEMVGTEGEEFEEVRPLTPSDQEIDLTDVVRDTLLLALPQRRVAPGAEEKSIDREFGPSDEEGNESVDPRWSKLQQLKDDDSSSE
jgi:uncharacterized protein